MASSDGRKRKADDEDEESFSSSSDEQSSLSSAAARRHSRREDRKKRKRKHKKSDSKKRSKKSSSSRRRDDENDHHDSESDESSRSNKRKKRRRRDDDDSDSSSSSTSYSERSSDRKKNKKRRKHSKDRKRKRDKKKKKTKKKSSATDLSDDNRPTFGKFGILRPSDFHKKSRSFTVWLEEVKGVTDAPKYELQNYFKDYMEDFNTATLPHRKYYDYDKWEIEEWESKKAAAVGSQSTSARQEEAIHMQKLQDKAQEKRKQELELVKTMMSKEKREEMKRKADLQAQMAHAYKTGDQESYIRLKNRLEPER